MLEFQLHPNPILVPIPNGQIVALPQAIPDDPSSTQARPIFPVIVTSFIQHNLMPGENLIAVTHIHPMVIVEPAIMLAFFMLVGLIGALIAFVFFMVGFLMSCVALILLVARWIERLTTEFSCTDRRILIKSGLITTRLREMPLAKVEALVVVQRLFGKVFGYGTLVFKGSGGTRRTCNDIEQPFAFYRSVQEQVARAQKRAP